MNMQEYADIINVAIHLTYYPNQNTRWCASFEHAEIKVHEGSGVLISEHGNADTPTAAMQTYVESIRGKILVLNASGSNSREYTIPANLSVS